MVTVTARILDSTHRELSQPIEAPQGEYIRIAIPAEGEDERMWIDGTKMRHFFDAYDSEDAIYDDL